MLTFVFHTLSRSRWLKNVASRYGMRRPTSFARRFIAGETVAEAIDAARALEAQGLSHTLDLLGENVTTLEGADAATRAYPAIATHDEAMIDLAREWAQKLGLGADRFEFQMLYGIRRDLQAALVKDAYRVRIYVPFGRQWFPYFMGASASVRRMPYLFYEV